MSKTSTCSIDGCGGQVFGRGWCQKHYSKWRNHGDPLTVIRPKRSATCTIEACNEPHEARGWCSKHYARWTRNGDPNKVRPLNSCEVEGCTKRGAFDRYCQRHAGSLKRYGDAEWVDSPVSRGDPCIAEGCEGLAWNRGLCPSHYHRERRYGVTHGEYAAALELGCPICLRKADRLVVDHDHACCPSEVNTCGECVRDLICRACNSMLGLAADDPARLRAAADYLEIHRTEGVTP